MFTDVNMNSPRSRGSWPLTAATRAPGAYGGAANPRRRLALREIPLAALRLIGAGIVRQSHSAVIGPARG